MNTMITSRPEANEFNLLEQAIAAFNERFKGLQGFGIAAASPSPEQNGKRKYDGLVSLRKGKQAVSYWVEIKPRLSHAVRHLLVMQKASAERPLLLVSQFVNPKMAEHLIKDGIEFVDTAGNAYINLGFLNIISKGNPPKDRLPLRSPRLFKAAGLKVVFALLSRPELITGALRKIASSSAVSIGTSAGILNELKTRIYLIKGKSGARRLIRKKELFEAWVTAYPEQLRPKVFLGKYRGENDWWHKKNLDPALAQWGGEIAASRLTDYLYPQLATVYLSASRLNDFLLGNKLALDKNGNVEILERFWPADPQTTSKELVHPLLIYADLMASGIDRNIETAKGIYDRHIARHLRED